MLIGLLCLAGCVAGWVQAGRRGGNIRDKVHFAAVYGLCGMVVGVLIALAMLG
ncbi:MAG: hypothetical protein OXB95_01025 [Rhodobacteraceae bacterium]|nr:hypothetical protein [Paracoccaceae bacterium]